MNTKENFLAALNYENYESLPVLHFGFWRETLQKWADEGHIAQDEAENYKDGNAICEKLSAMLGFDWGYTTIYSGASGLFPHFEEKVIKEFPDGSSHIRDAQGVTLLKTPGAGSIPSEIEHLLTDRASFEKHYRHRLQWSDDRVDMDKLEELKEKKHDFPVGIFAGTLIGGIRNILGVVGLSYMTIDNPELLDEIITFWTENTYKCLKMILGSGIKVDFIHFWEDICFKNGPLVTPDFFREKMGPGYKRITDVAREYGINIVSVDCDGKIDELVPTWLENGVNTMFPIEVGTWNASIKPWREKYGKQIRGVGGMNKNVFGGEKSDIDREIERLKTLVELGGYIPCPDHRIPPDAKWDMVRYYCDRMKKEFQ